MMGNQTYQFQALPFGLATAPLEFTRLAKRDESSSSVQRYKNSSIPGRLAAAISNGKPMSRTDPKYGQNRSEIRLGSELREIRVKTNSNTRFLGYHFNLRHAMVFLTHTKKKKNWKILLSNIQKLESSHITTARSLMSLIGVQASLEKQVPLGRLHMRLSSGS